MVIIKLMSRQVSRGSVAMTMQMRRQVSRGSVFDYQVMNKQVSLGSAGYYQADEQAGVARLSFRLSGR